MRIAAVGIAIVDPLMAGCVSRPSSYQRTWFGNRAPRTPMWQSSVSRRSRANMFGNFDTRLATLQLFSHRSMNADLVNRIEDGSEGFGDNQCYRDTDDGETRHKDLNRT